MDQRPKLNKEISIKDFQDFYWLKTELQQFCKLHKIPSNKGKLELASSIEQFLTTGLIEQTKPIKTESSFDWSKEKLTLETLITDSYKNTENVRSFFQQNIGTSFKFNVQWMSWFKENIGANLADSIKVYHAMKESKINREIAPQFEYNKYMKACKSVYPHLSHSDVVSMWNCKRNLRGPKKFHEEDISFLEV